MRLAPSLAALAAAGMIVTGVAIAPAADAAEVNLYSSRHYDSDEALYAKFTEMTGIEVNVVEDKGGVLIERLKAEGDLTEADVFITVDAGNLWKAQQEGVLGSVDSDVLEAAIPANLRDPEGHWFGLTKRVRGIVYDKEAVDPADLPDYTGLADDDWQGRLLIRSSSNIYNQSMVGALIEKHGEDALAAWSEGVVANMARVPQGGDTDQIRAVAAGEGEIAVSNHYYLARLMRSDNPDDRAVADKVGFFFPGQDGLGAHVNISGAGVTAHAPNRENAIRFLEFLVSEEAQEAFAGGNNEYPVVAGAEPNDILKGFGDFTEMDISATVYGENNAKALMVMDRAGWR